MTFQEMFDEASAAGVTPAQMRLNCIEQAGDYLRNGYFSDKRARRYKYGIWKNGADWRRSARRCFAMLRWLKQTRTP